MYLCLHICMCLFKCCMSKNFPTECDVNSSHWPRCYSPIYKYVYIQMHTDIVWNFKIKTKLQTWKMPKVQWAFFGRPSLVVVFICTHTYANTYRLINFSSFTIDCAWQHLRQFYCQKLVGKFWNEDRSFFLFVENYIIAAIL